MSRIRACQRVSLSGDDLQVPDTGGSGGEGGGVIPGGEDSKCKRLCQEQFVGSGHLGDASLTGERESLAVKVESYMGLSQARMVLPGRILDVLPSATRGHGMEYHDAMQTLQSVC